MRFSKILYVVLLYAYAGVLQYDRIVSHNNPGLPYLPTWVTAGATFRVWALLLIVADILVVLDVVRKAIRSEGQRLIQTMLWFKVALIPFYAWAVYYLGGVVLAFGAYGAVGFLAAAFGGVTDPGMVSALIGVGALASLAGWLVAAIAIGLIYIAFLPTSADGIAFLIMLRRKREIGVLAFLVHLVLQLLLVADLVSTVILLAKYRKTVVSGGDVAAAGAVEATA